MLGCVPSLKEDMQQLHFYTGSIYTKCLSLTIYVEQSRRIIKADDWIMLCIMQWFLKF